MPANENPVYTDNSTILGDGTSSHPLHAGGAETFSVRVAGANVNPTVMPGTEIALQTLTITTPGANKSYNVDVWALYQFTNTDGDGDNIILRIRLGTDETGTLLQTLTNSVLATQAKQGGMLFTPDSNNADTSTTRSYTLTAEWASAGAAQIDYCWMLAYLTLNS